MVSAGLLAAADSVVAAGAERLKVRPVVSAFSERPEAVEVVDVLSFVPAFLAPRLLGDEGVAGDLPGVVVASA